MPWDGTELRVGDLARTAGSPRPGTVLGGATESVLQPEWLDERSLYVVSDRSGWWNLYRIDLDGEADTVPCSRPTGVRRPAVGARLALVPALPDGRLLTVAPFGTRHAALLDPATGDADRHRPRWPTSVRLGGAGADRC